MTSMFGDDPALQLVVGVLINLAQLVLNVVVVNIIFVFETGQRGLNCFEIIHC